MFDHKQMQHPEASKIWLVLRAVERSPYARLYDGSEHRYSSFAYGFRRSMLHMRCNVECTILALSLFFLFLAGQKQLQWVSLGIYADFQNIAEDGRARFSHCISVIPCDGGGR